MRQHDYQDHLDKAGRVSIPKPLRQELHLAPGDALRLVRATMPIRKEDRRMGVPLGQAGSSFHSQAY
ncbi:MAG: AbrB/MazE/SpoVT family DNA-binding domain-containing protein [Acidobacteriia bacterium]|nr:AbrB/MazE/SpoVT family DNA-binding domain-containing protein [Terriglobia bacterium]